MNIRNHKFSAIILRCTFVISIFLLFFTVSISYRQIQSVADSEKWVIHSHEVQIDLQQLLYYVKDAETAQRGYLLTHDTVFFSAYQLALGKVKESIDKLKTITADNKDQQKNITTLSYLIDERFALLTYIIGNKNLQITISEPLKKRLIKGKNLMDKMAIQSDKMLALEIQVLKKREIEHKQAINLSPLSYLVTAFFSLFVFVAAYYKIKKDVDNLKKVNNQLLITQETFDHAEQIAEISNWCWNLDANKLSYSNNQYRLLGCEPHEFEPTVENFMEYVHPDDRHIVEDGSRKALTESVPSISYFRVIRKDGVVRRFKSIGKLIIDNYGTKILIGINADVTNQYFNDKILEEKLLDLERSNKELSAFNHVASHDLQEPLRKIQTLISRIEEKDAPSLSEKGKEFFSRIKISANRMQKLIDDLLLFSRTNKTDKVFELTDLNKIMDSSKQELAQLIEEKGVTIKSSSLPVLKVIPFQIQQLFINLIGNSIKYSKPDTSLIVGINTSIVSGKEIPGGSVSGDKKYHKISFSDNGIGFEQQYAERIFTLFNRLHDDKEYSGTGIGLTICKKIVENHNGFITAEGIPNVGSAFHIFLPVS